MPTLRGSGLLAVLLAARVPEMGGERELMICLDILDS
jgi:hypothetical protein